MDESHDKWQDLAENRLDQLHSLQTELDETRREWETDAAAMENSFLTEAHESCDRYEKMLAQADREHAEALAAAKDKHEQELAKAAQLMQKALEESAKEREEALSVAEKENMAALALADQKMKEAVIAERRKLEMAHTKYHKEAEFQMQEELTLQLNQMEREKYEAESRSDQLQQQLMEMKLEALAIRDAMSAEMIKSAHLSASLSISETKRDRFEAMCTLLESEVQSLNHQCEQIMETLGETESETAARVRKMASLEETLAQTKHSLTATETNLAESNLNLKKAQTQLTHIQKTNSDLESEIARLDAHLSETVKAHEKQLATLQRELSKQQDKSLLELREKLETQHTLELEDLANRHQTALRTQRKELSANGLQQSSQSQLRLDELEEEVLELKRAHSREIAKLKKAVSVSGEEAIKDLESQVEEAERVGACWKKDAERLQKALHRAIEMGKASLEEFEKEVDGERDLWDLERKALMSRIGTLETRLDTISETLKAASESQKDILSEPIHKSIMSATAVPPTAPNNNAAVPRRRARHSDVSQLLEISAKVGKSAKVSQKQAVSKSSLRKVQPSQDSDSEEIVPETQLEDALSNDEASTVTERQKERGNQSNAAEPSRQKHRKNMLSDDDGADEGFQERLKPQKANKEPSTKKRAAPSKTTNLDLPAQSNVKGSDAAESASRKSNKRVIDSQTDEADVANESALPSQSNARNEANTSNIMPTDADASKPALEKIPKKSTKKARVVLPDTGAESRDVSEGLTSEQPAPQERSTKTDAKLKKQVSTKDDELSDSEDRRKAKTLKPASKPKKTASKKDDENSGSENEKDAGQPVPRQPTKRAAAVGKTQPYWVIGRTSSESANASTKPSNKKRLNADETPDSREDAHHLETSEETSGRANPSIGNAKEEEPTDRTHAVAKNSTPKKPLEIASRNPLGKQKTSQHQESDTASAKDDQPEKSKKIRVRKEKKDAPSKSSEQKELDQEKPAKRKPEESAEDAPTIQSNEDSEVRNRENKSDAVEKKKRKLGAGKVTAAEETDEVTPAANPLKLGALRMSLEPNKKGIFSFSKPSLTGLPGFQGLISRGTPSNLYQSLGTSLNTSALSEFEKARTMRQGQKRLDALKAGQTSKAAAENGGA
ncbi:hypothetical protein HDU81_004655 [Chytriomyces hyalinus]|nr:hypothetical protein HDU81_004655 [Chytriomyces hyalinus]